MSTILAPAALLLPNELLALIFLSARSEPDVLSITPFHPDEAPIVFTRVCQKWRLVALGTPQLWSTLLIPTSDNPAIAYALEKWLDWSQELPLTLSMDLRNAAQNPEAISKETENEYVAALSRPQVAERLYSARLLFYRERALRNAAVKLGLIPRNTPSLPALPSITKLELGAAQSDPQLPVFTELAPCDTLQSLYIRGWRQFLLRPVFACPPALRDLSIVYNGKMDADMALLLNCISRCHKTLSSLELNVPYVAFDLSNPSEHVHCALSVRHLTINISSMLLSLVLPHLFSAPVVETLSLRAADVSAALGLQHFLQTQLDLAKQSRKLRHLDTNLNSHDTAERRTAVVQSRTISTLKLHGLLTSPMDVAFFQDLTLVFDVHHQGMSLCDGQGSMLRTTNNHTLQHLYIDVADRVIHPDHRQFFLNVDRTTPFLDALVALIESRVHVPDGAISVDGEPVQKLLSVGLGPNMRVLCMDYPAQAERGSIVQRLYSLLEELQSGGA